MKSVQLTSRAKKDFDRAIAYSAKHFGPKQATIYASGLNRALLSLGHQPFLGRPVKTELQRLRILLHQFHFIYYRIDTHTISILKIVDARRATARHL